MEMAGVCLQGDLCVWIHAQSASNRLQRGADVLLREVPGSAAAEADGVDRGMAEKLAPEDLSPSEEQRCRGEISVSTPAWELKSQYGRLR